MADESDRRPDSDIVPAKESAPKSVRTSVEKPEWIEGFIEMQREEVRVRADELAIRKIEAGNAHEYSMHSLKCLVDDRKEDRQHRSEQSKRRYLFSGVVLLAFVGLLVFLVDRGKDRMAEEVLKIVVYAGAGGFGGYAWGRHRERQSKDSSSDDDAPDSG